LNLNFIISQVNDQYQSSQSQHHIIQTLSFLRDKPSLLRDSGSAAEELHFKAPQ
jgi:hypothetical protein